MLSPQEIADCRIDFKTYIKEIFKHHYRIEFIFKPHHEILINAMEQVVTGDIQNLIINMPPRHGKTEIAIVMFCSWCFGNFPDSKFINASVSATLSQENAIKVRDVLRSDIFNVIYPDFELKKDKNAADHFKNIDGGEFYSCGAGGGIIGHGFGGAIDDGLFHGAGIIDDPMEAMDAYSVVKRNKINTWCRQGFKSRANHRTSPKILIMQRLHELDLSAFLAGGGSGEEWYSIVIPILDEDGEPIWDDKYSKEDLESIKKADPYFFESQLMQQPTPIGGGIFKDSYWSFYKKLPVIISKRIYADTALKTKESNDYSVFQCWGKSQNGQIYLLDQVRGKWESPELLIQARAFYLKHNVGYAHVNAFKIEDKASGTGLIQSLKREGLPIVAIPRNIDKVTRARDCTGLLSSGNVFLPEDWEGLSDYLSEFTAFPNSKHDDQVDPTMDAIEDFLRNDTIDYAEMFK
jgi:predicted phage terminase large subunit-like protein